MSRFCKHPHRIHALGGGQFVCFRCWLSLVLGVRRTAKACDDARGKTP